MPLALVMRTEALGTPAPEGSVTNPVNPPVPPAAGAAAWPAAPPAGACAHKRCAKRASRMKHKKHAHVVRTRRKLINSPNSVGLPCDCALSWVPCFTAGRFAKAPGRQDRGGVAIRRSLQDRLHSPEQGDHRRLALEPSLRSNDHYCVTLL